MAEISPLAQRLITANPRRSFVTLVSLLLAFLLGVFDAVIEPDISSTVLYLLPIILASWYAGFEVGVFVAVFGVLAAIAGDLLTEVQYRNIFVPLWNFGSRFIVHVLIVYVFTILRKHLNVTDAAARTDALTGLGNRRHFYHAAEIELRRLKFHPAMLTVVYFDLDNFKLVNDRYGHQMGDRALQKIGEALRASLRRSDVVARIGGDEFAVLLPNTPPAAANEILARVRQNLNRTMQENRWPVTFSIGVATFSARPNSVDEMLNAVDRLMYVVKSQGKNGVFQRVIGHADLSPESGRAVNQTHGEIL